MTKRKLIICLLVLLLIGCKRVDNNDDYISYVYNCLNDNSITNNVSLGYKYYVPKGIKKIHDYDYNQIFLNGDTKIYLYVDIISYSYKKELVIDRKDDSYFEKFKYNGNGYIQVLEEDDGYFVTIVYNYARVEFFSSGEELGENITLSSIILNSIKYNDVVIDKILEGDLGEFSEFAYELDKPEDASSNFSQILEEYVQKDDEINDDDNLPGE